MVTDELAAPASGVVLLLGGTRSGKSRLAESIATDLAGPRGRVTYLATARVDPADRSHRARIDAHQARRPSAWATIECEHPDDLATHLNQIEGVVLVDSLGTWLTLDPDLRPDLTGLVIALEERRDPTVVVSEEVGLSVHPPTDLGRRYVDALGELNEAVAAVAQRVLLVVAGRAVSLDRWTGL